MADMSTVERSAGFRLLKTAALVDFRDRRTDHSGLYGR